MALGANRGNILTLLFAGVLRLILVGMAVGAALALAMRVWIDSLLGTNGTSPFALVAAALLLCAWPRWLPFFRRGTPCMWNRCRLCGPNEAGQPNAGQPKSGWRKALRSEFRNRRSAFDSGVRAAASIEPGQAIPMGLRYMRVPKISHLFTMT